jgi:hypothetical protein
LNLLKPVPAGEHSFCTHFSEESIAPKSTVSPVLLKAEPAQQHGDEVAIAKIKN